MFKKKKKKALKEQDKDKARKWKLQKGKVVLSSHLLGCQIPGNWTQKPNRQQPVNNSSDSREQYLIVSQRQGRHSTSVGRAPERPIHAHIK